MTNSEDKNLSSLETYLQRLIQETKRSAFTTDEVTRLLKSHGPLNEDTLEDEETISLMEQAHERREQVERKLNNKSLIRSLGELLSLFVDINTISIEGLARCLNITTDELVEHVKDRRSPEHLGIDRLLDLAALLRVSIDELVSILDKTVNLLRIKKGTNLAAGHARADKDLSESGRQSVTADAMKELLLSIEKTEHKPVETDSWDEFKKNLLDDAGKDEPPPNILSLTCFTLKPGFGH